MTTAIVAVRGEHYFFPVMTKHGECIKTFVTAYLLQASPIKVYKIHVERETTFVFMITTKNNMLSIGRKIRCPVSLTKICYLLRIRSISISNKYFHLCWCYYALC